MNKGLVRNDLSELERDLTETGLSANILQLKEGVNRVRLLMQNGYLRYHVHFIPLELLPEDETLSFGSMVVCLKEFGQPCPICDYAQLLFQSVSELNQMRAKKIYAKERFKFIVIDRDETRKDVSPVKILSCGRMIADGIKECYKSYGDPSDPEKGYDLQIELKKVEGWNRYKVSPVVRLVTRDGKRTLELVETPLTDEEKAYKLPSLEDSVMNPDIVKDDLMKVFEPLILEIKEELGKEGTSAEVREFDGSKESVSKKIEPSSDNLGFGKPENKEEAKLFVTDKEVTRLPVTGEGKQKEKEEKTEKVSIKRPRCFGMYDPEDKENCQNCRFAKECEAITS